MQSCSAGVARQVCAAADYKSNEMIQDSDDGRVEGGQRRHASYVSCDTLGEKRHKLVQTDNEMKRWT